MNPLRAIRQSRGLSLVQVAAAAGTSVKTIQKIEQGRFATLYVRTLVRVALAVGVAPAELIPGLAAPPRAR